MACGNRKAGRDAPALWRVAVGRAFPGAPSWRIPRLLAALVLLLPAVSQAAWVIPAGRESQVEGWLLPLASGATVTDDWQLENIAIDHAQVRLGLKQASAPTVRWVAVAPAERPTLALEVVCPPDLPASVCQRVQAEIAKPHTNPPPWQHVAPRPPRRAPPQTPPHYRERVVALLAWLGFAVAGALVLWRRRHAWRSPLALGALGITLLGLILRVAMSPRTFLHENFRIAMHRDFLVSGGKWDYGESLTALVLLVNDWTGAGVDALFGVSLGFSILAVPALMALDAALFGARTTTLFVGFCAALSPLALRFAACEEPWPMTLFLATVAMTAWLRWLARAQGALLALTVTASVLAMQSRPEWLMFPVVLLALMLAVHGSGRLRDLPWRPLALAAVAGVVLLLPRLVGLADGHVGKSLAINPVAMLHVYAPFDPEITSPLYGLLVVGGLVWGWRHARARMAALVTMHLVLSVLPLAFFCTQGPYAQRTQFVPMLLLTVVAGHALDLTLPWISRRAHLVAAVAIITAQWAGRIAYVGRLYDQQLEWQFLVDGVPRLPTGITLLAPIRGETLGGFPRYLPLRSARDWQFTDLEDAFQTGQWPEADGKTLIYLGMACYVSHGSSAQKQIGAGPACAAARTHYRLEPVLTTRVANLPYPPTFHAAAGRDGYEVGFYRIQPRSR